MSLSDATVMKLYNQGRSCAEIARMDGRSETTIYNRLKSLDVTMRSRSEANKIFSDFIFISLYNLGLSVSQVGRLLGVDSSTVTKRLHSIGFPLRSYKVATDIRYNEEEFQKYFVDSNILSKFLSSTVMGR